MSIKVKKPVVRKKLSETVEEELEMMIRQGELAEGEALPSERDLMAAFGVGRPSIRDALSALQRKGLVKTYLSVIRAESREQGLALLLMSPEFQWR